ncbi:thiamine transporter ThiT [Clostridia bacterium]|nr:thiamine transporter ThiT [Clostridia bacterium]
MKNNATRKLVESAILVAIAYILSYMKVDLMPNGGSVTLLSMLPLLLIGIRNGPYWGVGAGVVYGALQLLQGIYPPPVANFGSFAAMILLDYIVAWGVIGLAGLAVFRGNKWGLAIAAPICLALRYASHVLSGVIVWGSYDLEIWGHNINEGGTLAFSLLYNGTYMIPEIISTTIVAVILVKAAPKLLEKN